MATHMVQEEVEKKKVHLGIYPYTYVRTVVMRSLLFKSADYQKMLKMSFSEIARFLQDSQYKAEIDQLASKYHGAALVEQALARNMTHMLDKLKRISPGELGSLIIIYLKRYDVYNIKTLIRAKFTKASEEAFGSLLIPVGNLSRERLKELFQKDSVETIVREAKIAPLKHVESALSIFQKEKNLFEIENALDRAYYTELISFLKQLPEEGKLFREFLETEIEVTNVLTVLRLKKENKGKDAIKGQLFHAERSILLSSLLDAKDLDEAVAIVEKLFPAAKDAARKYQEQKSLIPVETSLYNYLLRKSLLLQHQHPLSVDVILGYLFAKEMEMRNLNVLVKAKQMKMDESFIEEQLVI